MKSAWSNFVLPICLLAAIVFICFGRSLSSYFLADDFSEISCMSRIFQGDYNSLLADFTGSHMQTSVMKVYRPGATVALFLNYVICHTNAVGYFLADILILLASSVMLYLLLRELSKSWEDKRSHIFALLGAALFAAHPLHCEPVSFISAEDYLVSSFFYLSGLLCFVKNRGAGKSRLLISGVALFWAAILCKEAAVGFALALFGIAFCLPAVFDRVKNQATQTNYSFATRLRLAIAMSMPAWISTVAYLALRFVVLGTITGGYIAGLGSTLTSSLIQRLTDISTLMRIAFPLNADVFGTTSNYGLVLLTLYIVIAVFIAMRLVLNRFSWEWLGLIAIWSLSAVAPLYQVWSLGSDLEGGRFFFFLTIPLSVLLPAAILAPRGVTDLKLASSPATTTETKAIEMTAVISLFVLVLVDTAITYNNNIPWVHAGKQTKACLIEGQKLAQSVPPGKKIAVIGLPQVSEGAHMIYNGTTFNIMMSPPFSKHNYADKFITFSPLFYGSPVYINAQRFKSVLRDPNVTGLYVWNSSKLKFAKSFEGLTRVGVNKPEPKVLLSQEVPVPVIPGSVQSQSWMQQGTNTCSLIVSPLNLEPNEFDFIEVEVASPLPRLASFLYWPGFDSASQWCDLKYPVQGMLNKGTSRTAKIRLRVSDHWQWYTNGSITKLKLDFVPWQLFEVVSIRALPGNLVMPSIAVTGVQATNLGVYQIGKSGVNLDFDGSTVAGCVAIKIEVSKPYYSFEGLTSGTDKTAIMNKLPVAAKKGHTQISNSIFPSPGYYQLRAVCIDNKGMQIGEPSDPITLGI